MHKKAVCAVAMTLGIVITASSMAFASPASLDQQLNTSKSKYSSTHSKVSSAKKKANDLTAQIQKLDAQIQQIVLDIDKINKNISDTETGIKTAEIQVQEAQESIKIEQERYNKSIRTMYMNGSNGYLSALLDAKGINDFISKVEIINKITEYNKKIVDNLNERRAEVNSKKEVLSQEKNRLVALKTSNSKKIAELNKQKQSEQPLLAQAKTELNSAVALDSAAQAEVDELNSKVTAMRQASAASVNRGSLTSYSSDAVVTYAASFRGINYVYGGESPSGFDCSGLMQYVYSHFGVSLPRTSFDQYSTGSSVSQSDLKPGDLVFFNGASHVGMYVGNGLMIHAPHTGTVVQIAPVSSNGGYCGARRVH